MSGALLRDDEELLALPTNELLYQYVEEIFSDYRDQKATLREALDEMKGIIDVLLAPRANSVLHAASLRG